MLCGESALLIPCSARWPAVDHPWSLITIRGSYWQNVFLLPGGIVYAYRRAAEIRPLRGRVQGQLTGGKGRGNVEERICGVCSGGWAHVGDRSGATVGDTVTQTTQLQGINSIVLEEAVGR